MALIQCRISFLLTQEFTACRNISVRNKGEILLTWHQSIKWFMSKCLPFLISICLYSIYSPCISTEHILHNFYLRNVIFSKCFFFMFNSGTNSVVAYHIVHNYSCSSHWYMGERIKLSMLKWHISNPNAFWYIN